MPPPSGQPRPGQLPSSTGSCEKLGSVVNLGLKITGNSLAPRIRIRLIVNSLNTKAPMFHYRQMTLNNQSPSHFHPYLSVRTATRPTTSYYWTFTLGLHFVKPIEFELDFVITQLEILKRPSFRLNGFLF